MDAGSPRGGRGRGRWRGLDLAGGVGMDERDGVSVVGSVGADGGGNHGEGVLLRVVSAQDVLGGGVSEFEGHRIP